MSKIELKPCPFCGSFDTRLIWEYSGKAIINGWDGIEGSAYVACGDCGASTAQFLGGQKDSGDFCCGNWVIVRGVRIMSSWAFTGTIKEKAAYEWNRRESHVYVAPKSGEP